MSAGVIGFQEGVSGCLGLSGGVRRLSRECQGDVSGCQEVSEIVKRVSGDVSGFELVSRGCEGVSRGCQEVSRLSRGGQGMPEVVRRCHGRCGVSGDVRGCQEV